VRVVVAGAGEVGRQLARGLATSGHDVVMIDRRQEALAAAEENLDIRAVRGDIAFREVLLRAGVAESGAFIAVTGSDDANMLSGALAKAMGASTVVARVDDPGFFVERGASERGLLGVDHVLCSPRLTTAALLTMVAASDAPFARSFAAGRLVALLWRVCEEDRVVGREPRGLGMQAGAWLGAVARDGFLRRPEEVGRVEPGDLLLLAGAPEAVASSVTRQSASSGGERYVVTGGSTVGALVANNLAERGARVEIVELDRARARDLAQRYPGVRILQGDATDVDFLKDIRLEDATGVVAATYHDEVNLLTTMLVRQTARPGKPAPHTWAAVTRPGYADLCRRVGIEGTASTFEVLAQAVQEAIRPPGLVCSGELPELAWSVAHLRLPDSLPADLRLDDLPLPVSAHPIALLQGTTVVAPSGAARLGAGDDRVAVLPTRDLAQAQAALRGLKRSSR
jgi:trk system potassium uptake protein TrkA